MTDMTDRTESERKADSGIVELRTQSDSGTKISWTDETWNPVHGCSKVSEGCKNCYAERISYRKFSITDHPWTEEHAEANVQLKPYKLDEPRKFSEPTRIFVNSMSDLFHRLVPDEFIHDVFDVIEDLPQHRFQILTKRPERAVEWSRWPDNVWMGTSVENARVADRIDTISQCDANVLFISFEPLLAPVGDVDLSEIDWAIVGGESGQNYRPMDHAWAREIRDLCVRDEVAFFFKQSAAYRTEMGTELIEEDGSKRIYNEFPAEIVDFEGVTIATETRGANSGGFEYDESQGVAKTSDSSKPVTLDDFSTE